MKRLIGMTAALMMAGATTPASARIDELNAVDRADMQCFALTAYLTGQSTEGSQEQAGLVGGMMYFLGRLDGRTPGTDWLSKLADYLRTVEGAELEAQRERCGGIMVERGDALTRWGATLSGEAPGS